MTNKPLTTRKTRVIRHHSGFLDFLPLGPLPPPGPWGPPGPEGGALGPPGPLGPPGFPDSASADCALEAECEAAATSSVGEPPEEETSGGPLSSEDSLSSWLSTSPEYSEKRCGAGHSEVFSESSLSCCPSVLSGAGAERASVVEEVAEESVSTGSGGGPGIGSVLGGSADVLVSSGSWSSGSWSSDPCFAECSVVSSAAISAPLTAAAAARTSDARGPSEEVSTVLASPSTTSSGSSPVSPAPSASPNSSASPTSLAVSASSSAWSSTDLKGTVSSGSTSPGFSSTS